MLNRNVNGYKRPDRREQDAQGPQLQQQKHRETSDDVSPPSPSSDMYTGNLYRPWMSQWFRDICGTSPSSHDDPKDIIYYLSTSSHHNEENIGISGPYKYLSEVFHQARQVLGEDCQPGIRQLEDSIDQDGHLMPFGRISSQVNCTIGGSVTVECICRTNPRIAARLPCPVWNVICWQPVQEQLPYRNQYIAGSFQYELEAGRSVDYQLYKSLAEVGEPLHAIALKMWKGNLIGEVFEVSNRLVKWAVTVEDASLHTPQASAQTILLDTIDKV